MPRSDTDNTSVGRNLRCPWLRAREQRASELIPIVRSELERRLLNLARAQVHASQLVENLRVVGRSFSQLLGFGNRSDQVARRPTHW
jgi:hypothetical protein